MRKKEENFTVKKLFEKIEQKNIYFPRLYYCTNLPVKLILVLTSDYFVIWHTSNREMNFFNKIITITIN